MASRPVPSGGRSRRRIEPVPATMLRINARCNAPSAPGGVARFTPVEQGGLVGVETVMSATTSQPRNPGDRPPVVVEVPGPGEWIVGAPTGGRQLHIYRVAPGDWLVSEVGRTTEGRGADLAAALAALSGISSAPGWWSSVPAALENEVEPAR